VKWFTSPDNVKPPMAGLACPPCDLLSFLRNGVFCIHGFAFSQHVLLEVCQTFPHPSSAKGARECRVHGAPAVSCVRAKRGRIAMSPESILTIVVMDSGPAPQVGNAELRRIPE